MSNQLKSLINVNLSGVLLGTSGILSKLIFLPAHIIIFGRALVAMICLVGFVFITKQTQKINSIPDRVSIVIQGILLTLHWVTFVHSIQVSSVAIGFISFFTYPLMTTILETILYKDRFEFKKVINGLLVLTALWLITPEFTLGSASFHGVLWGLFSASCFAIRNLLSQHSLKSYSSAYTMTLQVIVSTLCLLPFSQLFHIEYTQTDIIGIIFFGTVVTALAHTLLISSLKSLKASTVALVASIEPVFGILFAFIFLKETPSMATILGGSLILYVVVSETINNRKADLLPI